MLIITQSPIRAIVHASVLFSVSASGLSILRIRKWLVGVDELLRVTVQNSGFRALEQIATNVTFTGVFGSPFAGSVDQNSHQWVF